MILVLRRAHLHPNLLPYWQSVQRMHEDSLLPGKADGAQGMACLGGRVAVKYGMRTPSAQEAEIYAFGVTQSAFEPMKSSSFSAPRLPNEYQRLSHMSVDAIFRTIFLLVFLSSLVISGYHRKRARGSGEAIPRRAEGSLALLLRMAMALLVAVSFFAYIFAPRWLSWSDLGLPLWLRWGAAILAVACIPAFWWVLVSIGDNISETVLTKSTHQLVTHGPYRWIRHPLYAFTLLELLALGLLASNWLLLAFPCVGAVVFRWVVIPREEANLIKAFGNQYEDYKARTGALLPRLRP